MPLGILRPGDAEIRAETPIGCGTLGDRPAFNGDAAQQYEAATVEHRPAQTIEHRAKRRQREVLTPDIGDIESTRVHRLQRTFDLSDFGGRQTIAPFRLTRAHISGEPDGRALDRPTRRCHDVYSGGGHWISPANHQTQHMPRGFIGIPSTWHASCLKTQDAERRRGAAMWDWSTFFHYLHSWYLIKGAGISLALSIGAMAIGLVFGTIAALMRRSNRWLLREPASFYVWLFRGTPVLVQLIIIYTGLPQLGIKLGVIPAALIGLGVNEGAYLAEIIRAGISAVPRGQFEAARAIGMTRATIMRVVVMPQALRIIIPPLGNAFNGLMKTSSLASVISMEELLRRTELLIQVQFKVLEIFIVAAIYYLILTTLWGFVQQRLEAHFSRSVTASDRGRGPATAKLRLNDVVLSHDAT
jgi:polar amino acid transport system permease protein